MNQNPVPVLVQNDPWLAEQTDAINRRIESFDKKLNLIKTHHKSLKAYANSHETLGVHFDEKNNRWTVAEWAPNAQHISIVGQFNDWNTNANPLTKGDHNIWTTTLPASALKHKDQFKLRIHGADDSIRDRIPATITRAIQDPSTHDYSAQIWAPAGEYIWENDFDPSTVTTPLIYEAHTGMAGEEPRVHTYRELADNILPHIADLGYNTIQLMAVQEHPYYGSFGYHVSNFFAACSRFGTPEDLKYLIDKAHGLNIAVIMDIVHSHAVKNLAEGLNQFDGTDHQYFHGGEKGNHPQWDSKCFNYAKEEVARFLLSNVRYWLEEYRFDGFRFDGITSMLYDHHGSIAFDHYDKYFSDGVDNDAILYLQLATTLAQEIRPGSLIIAEDMSGMPGLCRPTAEGGIGFTQRLAMGLPDYWIKLLKHSQDEDWNVDEIWSTLSNRRAGEANIAYAESHDQALVGDKTLAFWLMDKEMYWHMAINDDNLIIDRGIALHKIIRFLTFCIGGEGYLTFMGNEFGHPEWLDFPREGNDWSYHYCRRQWSLLENKKLKYQFMNNFDREMIRLGKQHDLLNAYPADQLWSHSGDKVLAFERRNLIGITNLHPNQSFTDYAIPVKQAGEYKIILNSDTPQNGGHNRIDTSITYKTHDSENGPKLSLYLPNRSALILQKIK